MKLRPQGWLAPLVPIYATAVAAKNSAHDRGLISQQTLQKRVVSIGNLSTGGGGKTPFTIALAKLLSASGLPVDVLSRGYGRSSHAIERVDPAADAAASRFGDEPLLIARAAGVPVYVGAQRYAAGLLAEEESLRLNENAPRMHLLDDGFQHRQLARDLDIVLLHRDDLRARLLPAGSLREPLTSLRRAHVVVVREADRDMAGLTKRYLQPGAMIWHMRRTLHVRPGDGATLAFCGIARPQDFFSELQASGVNLVDGVPFQDHHPFNAADIHSIGERARKSGATRILTTEKDLVRFSPDALQLLRQHAPVESVPLTVTLLEADQAVECMVDLHNH